MQKKSIYPATAHKPIAMAYVPPQKSPILYENLEEAFQKGTIFPELNKPFQGKRGRR